MQIHGDSFSRNYYTTVSVKFIVVNCLTRSTKQIASVWRKLWCRARTGHFRNPVPSIPTLLCHICVLDWTSPLIINHPCLVLFTTALWLSQMDLYSTCLGKWRSNHQILLDSRVHWTKCADNRVIKSCWPLNCPPVARQRYWRSLKALPNVLAQIHADG